MDRKGSLFGDVRTALVLAPHTDDGEFGCGGTIARMIEENITVYYAAFSACQQSVLPMFPKDILITEVKEATKRLGILPDNLFLFNYDVRTFNFKRQEILQDMVNIRNAIQPDLVMMPSLNDLHQDHAVIALEGMRAFKFTSIFSYEIPWNNINFETSGFVSLKQEHIAKKIEALQAYESQAHRPYANEEYLRAQLRTRGVQVGTEYAEVFDVIRWVVK